MTQAEKAHPSRDRRVLRTAAARMERDAVRLLNAAAENHADTGDEARAATVRSLAQHIAIALTTASAPGGRA